MQKGQTSIMPVAMGIVVAVVLVLIGTFVYALIAQGAPHDTVYLNETLCSGACVNGSVSPTAVLYEFDHSPMLNESSLVCYNASLAIMTRGDSYGTCLGYNIVENRYLNITNTSGAATSRCSIRDVVCTYTYDWATTDQQSFWNNATSNAFSGFVLLSIVGIVLAAVAIISVVLLLKGD